MDVSDKAMVGLQEMNAAMAKKLEGSQKPEQQQQQEDVQQVTETAPVRMKLNLDITAPLILVPSSAKTKPTFLLLDLGHILITHDSGPVEDVKDYGNFLIKLDRIGAFVQDADELPIPSMALIKPFSIELDIATKVSKDVSLPATTLRGKLDKFKICVTKEKLRDLIHVVTSIEPPPPRKQLEVPEHKETSTSGGPSVPLTEASSAKQVQEAQVKEVSFGANFELSEFCISVKDTGENKPVGGQSLLKTRIKHLLAVVEVSNWETKAGITLDS